MRQTIDRPQNSFHVLNTKWRRTGKISFLEGWIFEILHIVFQLA